MFRNLIPLLADRYRVIAPDYPGYGQSDAPDHTKFAYTFAILTDIVDKLTDKLGADRYAMYVMDYGAPIGYRLALKHPERVSGLIVQNGNAYEEGLASSGIRSRLLGRPLAEEPRAHSPAWSRSTSPSSSIPTVMGDVARISPDNWVVDQALLDRPGNKDIQLDLLGDYGTNVPLYPQFQAFFRERQPPTLIVWGKNDKIFPEPGAHPYLRDLPNAEMHILDSGHFALEDKLDVMAPLIRDFLDRKARPASAPPRPRWASTGCGRPARSIARPNGSRRTRSRSSPRETASTWRASRKAAGPTSSIAAAGRAS
jgi:pimeloyl-ACP methyl ester carboxylesterase